MDSEIRFRLEGIVERLGRLREVQDYYDHDFNREDFCILLEEVCLLASMILRMGKEPV